MDGYEKIDQYNPVRIEDLSKSYTSIITNMGENLDRDGLIKTPVRAAKAIQFLTHGYDLNPEEIVELQRFIAKLKIANQRLKEVVAKIEAITNSINNYLQEADFKFLLHQQKKAERSLISNHWN